MLELFPLILICAYLLDLLAGDPEWLPHPVRWIGRLVTLFERAARRVAVTPVGLRACGVLLALSVVGAVFAASHAVLYLAAAWYKPLFFALAVYITWTSLAVKSLDDEATTVISAMRESGLDTARERLARIVGRDTGALPRDGVYRAVAETVSESTSDGIIAPLFYFAVGGPPLMLAYKAVNTLDSMVGYRNERYRHLGWFSARLDDAANYVPARITALLVVCASFVLGYDWKGAVKVLARDGRAHPSPNSGMPEAAVAGALGLRFGGGASYGGVYHEKPYIGDHVVEPGPAEVVSALGIMRFCATAAVALALTAYGFYFFVL